MDTVLHGAELGWVDLSLVQQEEEAFWGPHLTNNIHLIYLPAGR